MTSSYQSTAFQSSAKPVDIFVAEPSVLPKTGAEELYSALSTVNPALQKFIGTRIESAIEDERADMTMEIAKKGFKQITKEHRERYGEEATNQLIGGSVFTQDEFDKRQAQNVGLTLKTDLATLYSNKTFNFTDRNGNEVTKPINHFAIDSPQYQEFIQDAASLTAEKTQGLSNKHLAKEFYPYQQEAIQQITAEHLKANNEYKLERYTNKLQGLMFSNWREYDQGNQEQALKNIQDMIESSVNLGLASKVTPTELLKIAKNQASRIFDIEQSSGGNGYNAANKYLKMIGKLKTGPEQLQKDGTYKQRELSQSFGEDILKFKTKLADSYEKLKKIERERVQANKEKNFIRFVKAFGDDNASLADLTRANPDPEDREFIFDTIEIYSDNRDEAFEEYRYRVGIGYYGNDVTRMFKDLAKIKADIGETFTEEDQKNYDKSYDKAFSRAGSKLRNYDTPTQRLHTDALKLLGNKGDMFQEFQNPKHIPLYLELKERVNRRIIDEVDDSKLNEQQREDKFREITSFYFSNIKAIKTGSYEEVGVFDTAKEKAKRIEDKLRDDAIQKLSEDYGLSVENATQIYDEDQVERFTENTVPQGSFNITPEEGETTQVQTQNTTDTTTDNTTTEPGLVELLREGIGNLFSMNDDQTEQLTTQLSSIRKNLDETSVGVVDTILNALSGPPAMAGEMPSVLDEIDITQPFTYNSLYRLALEVGFPPEDAKTAAAIALAESSGRAAIDTVQSGLDPNKENEFSLGLWQIDMQDTPGYMVGKERRPQFGIESNEELYNPLTNAKAAKILYDRRGGKFTDWATFNDGKYKQFLPKN